MSPVSPIFSPSPPLVVGESLLFRREDNTLHFVDILGRYLYVLDVNTLKARQVKTSDEVHAIRFCDREGKYVCVLDTGVGLLDEADGTVEILARVDEDTMFNDAEVDAQGRLWIGSCDKITFHRPGCPKGHTPTGALWKFEKSKLTCADRSELCLANGIVFSKDNTRLFINDTLAYKTFVFDFNLDEGTVQNKKTLVEWVHSGHKGIGGADGMDIDEDDNLYVPMFKHSKVLRVDSKTGKISDTIEVPAASPTDVRIVDGTLYVTTSQIESPKDENDGCVFKFDIGASGQETRKVVL